VALSVVKATRRLSNLVCSAWHMFQNVIKISSINIFCKRTVFEVTQSGADFKQKCFDNTGIVDRRDRFRPRENPFFCILAKFFNK
jgi:hypothetical protein